MQILEKIFLRASLGLVLALSLSIYSRELRADCRSDFPSHRNYAGDAPGLPPEIFATVAEDLKAKGLNIVGADYNRPWGGFFYIDETQIDKFIKIYFSNADFKIARGEGKLSPKILVVAPEKRLSWQYHHRRGEVWSVVNGPVGAMQSDTDEETVLKMYDTGSFVSIRASERHRLVGGAKWGVVAEIWQHTDPLHPSDEDDIVRVQDDFRRN